MADMSVNGQTLPALSSSDIDIIDNEPRVTDVRLAKALGYANVHKLRELANRHREALERFGVVFTHRGRKPGRGSAGGRPTVGMAFNKKQALFLGGKTDLPTGIELLIQMVEVFDAATSAPPTPPALALPAPAEACPPFCDGCAARTLWQKERGKPGISDWFPLETGGPITSFELHALWMFRDQRELDKAKIRKALKDALGDLSGEKK